MTPVISVIIPSYNHDSYILDAVNSVLTQSFGDLELIVIDDGSKDASVELLQSVKDVRLHVLTQNNQGAHAAIHRGLSIAQGKYLTILNSDDKFLPNRLEAALAIFAAQPEIGLVGSYIDVIDKSGAFLATKEGYHNLDPWPVLDPSVTFKVDNDLRTALLMQNYWSTTSNFIFPREIYTNYGPFRPLRYVHDWDFALRVLCEKPAKLIETPLLQYRVHPTNTISSNRVSMVFEILWILAVHLPHYLCQPWFWEVGETKRMEQIQSSIYLHGCESIFWQMQTFIQYGPPNSVLTLLEEGNPIREHYLAEIRRILDGPQPEVTSTDDHPGRRSSWLQQKIQRIFS